MDANSFQPQGAKVPQGALPVGVRPPGGPHLGQHFAVGVLPVQPTIQGTAPAQPQMQMQQQFIPQAQAQISSPSMPKGAQPVPLISPHLAGAMAPQPTIPQGPSMPQRPQFAPQAQVPALAQARPQQQGGADVVVGVEVVGEGPDGKTYSAPYDAVFPPGTKVLGMRYL